MYSWCDKQTNQYTHEYTIYKKGTHRNPEEFDYMIYNWVEKLMERKEISGRHEAGVFNPSVVQFLHSK